jgi:hypothetical protein
MGGRLREIPTFLINFRLPWGVLIAYFEIPELYIPFIKAQYVLYFVCICICICVFVFVFVSVHRELDQITDGFFVHSIRFCFLPLLCTKA